MSQSARWPRSPSADSDMAPAGWGQRGRGGWGGGRAGESGPPGRDPGYGAVGFWAVRGVRSAEGASALERTWSPTSPPRGHSGRNLRNPALRFKPATAPCSLCPLYLGPRGTFGGSFSRGPAGRRERLCTGVTGEGFGRVRVPISLWRPPVLAVCTSCLRGSSRRIN